MRSTRSRAGILVWLVIGLFALGHFAVAQSLSELTIAAEEGDAEAQFELGRAYDGGDGVIADIQTALTWYRRAANQSHADAMYYIALTYDYADRVDEDNAAAASWYRRAAELGHAESQAQLGLMYELGEGVAADINAARIWYEAAAENGDADGKGYLGDLYIRGAGVRQDFVKGLSLLEGAAFGGSFYGQMELARVRLEAGSPVEDRIEGLAWLLISGETANDDQDNTKRTDLLAATKPTDEEWSAARRRAVTLSANILRSAPIGGDTGFWLDTSDAALVEAAQRGLRGLRYYDGDITGLRDDAFDEALLSFIKDWRYKHGAQVTPDLIMVIGGALAYNVFESDEARSDLVENVGSGFFVSDDGLIITNEHVIEGCDRLSLSDGDALQIIAREASSDLALLKASGSLNASGLSLRSGRGLRPGDRIWVAGYPLGGYITSDLSIASGDVMALAGIGQDRREFQMSVPIQPGNSGGPVLDASGHVVGVVVSGLDKLGLVAELGDLPENVNFAISLGTLQSFLDTHLVNYNTAAVSSPQAAGPAVDPTAIVAIMCD